MSNLERHFEGSRFAARGATAPNRRRAVLALLLMTAACLALLPTSSAFAGRLFATGHDIDLHCAFGQQCGYVSSSVTYVRGDAPDPTKPVLVLERPSSARFSAALTMAFGAGTVPTVVMQPRDPAFATTPLNTSLYSAILIASDVTCGGCDLNEFSSTPDSDAINLRTADIAAFFNAGGGLLYGSGADHGNGAGPEDVYYNSAPLPVGGAAVSPPFTVTPEGMALGLTNADANCCATHNAFVRPPAGSSIVVAETDGAGSAETLFAEGTITGGDIFTLALTPATATNPTGESHTVTATLNNQDGPVTGESVLFTVTGANPRSGLSSGPTNASGETTFTYTGTSPGEDTITACADLDNDSTCDADEPTATATKTYIGDGPAESCDLTLMPVGCWSFGEAPGSTTANDATPNNNDGTYLGGVTLGVPGVLAGDTAALFDGVNDLVRVPDSDTLDVGDSFSAEGWIKRSATTKTHQLMNKGRNGLHLVVLSGASGNQVLLRKADVTTIARSSTGVPADGDFHHVVATKNGPGSARIYIDGVDVTAAAVSPTQVIQNTAFLLTFSITATTPATLDEFALYDRALTAGEVASRFALGSSPPPGS